MNLEKLPVRLERSEEWTRYIVDLGGGDRDRLQYDVEDILIATKQTKPKTGFLRSRFSRFLNGHGEEIYQWLKEGSEYGAALTETLKVDLATLRAKINMLASYDSSNEIPPSVLLRLIPLRFEAPGATLLEAMQNKHKTLTLAEVIESWPNARFEVYGGWLANNQLEENIARSTLPIAGAQMVKLKVEPLRGEDLENWLGVLQRLGVISSARTELLRARSRLAALLTTRSGDELIYMVKSLGSGFEDLVREIALLRIEWAKKRIREKFPAPHVHRWIDSTEAVEFSKHWLHITGTNSGTLTRREFNGIISRPKADSETRLDDLLELIRAGESERSAVWKVLGQEVLVELEESGLIRSDEGNRRKSEPMIDLTHALLVEHLQPEDIDELVFELSENFGLLADACAAATDERLKSIVDRALNRSRFDLAHLLFAICIGVSERRDSGASLGAKTLRSLWLSAVWCMIARGTTIPEHISIKTSESFSSSLKLFNLDDIEVLVADVARDTASRWHEDAPTTDELRRWMPYQSPERFWIDHKPYLSVRRALADHGDVDGIRYFLDHPYEYTDDPNRIASQIFVWAVNATETPKWLSVALSEAIDHYVAGEEDYKEPLELALSHQTWLFQECDVLEALKDIRNGALENVDSYVQFVNAYQASFSFGQEFPLDTPPKLRAEYGRLSPLHLETIAKLTKRSRLLELFYDGTILLPASDEWQGWALQNDRYLVTWIERTLNEEEGEYRVAQKLTDPKLAVRAWEWLPESLRISVLRATSPIDWPDDKWWELARELLGIEERFSRWADRSNESPPLYRVGDIDDFLAHVDKAKDLQGHQKVLGKLLCQMSRLEIEADTRQLEEVAGRFLKSSNIDHISTVREHVLEYFISARLRSQAHEFGLESVSQCLVRIDQIAHVDGQETHLIDMINLNELNEVLCRLTNGDRRNKRLKTESERWTMDVWEANGRDFNGGLRVLANWLGIDSFRDVIDEFFASNTISPTQKMQHLGELLGFSSFDLSVEATLLLTEKGLSSW